MEYKNISLGAAQFGSKYGITNRNKLNYDQIKKILKIAYKNKITNIDSAHNYGDAEIKLCKTLAKRGINTSPLEPNPLKTKAD